MCVVSALLSMVPVRSHAAALLLRWTSVPSATGYHVYFGDQSGVYRHRRAVRLLSVGSSGGPFQGITYFVARRLARGRPYFVAVTAYNRAGESDFSNEKEFVAAPSGVLRAHGGRNHIGHVGDAFLLGDAPEPGLRYIWLQRRGPAATLSTPTASQTWFMPGVPGVYKFLLVAYDANGAAATDTVIIRAYKSRSGMAAAAYPAATPALASSSARLVESVPSPSPTPTPSPSPTAS